MSWRLRLSVETILRLTCSFRATSSMRSSRSSRSYPASSRSCLSYVWTKGSGTLQYALYLNGDQSECMFIERYRDSEAAIEHTANLGLLFAPVLATVSVVHGELLGEPSAELR